MGRLEKESDEKYIKIKTIIRILNSRPDNAEKQANE